MYKKHALMQVDAFSDHPLGGNPCAVVFECGDMDAALMQAIALEMNLSETAFVMDSANADFRVRYFTPAEEIPMAGHPTIATTYALVQSGRVRLTEGKMSITLELNVGPINVDIFSKGGTIERIVMTQKKPQFLMKHDPENVLPLFGLSSGDLLPGMPIQTVSTGTPQLMIPVKDHKALRKIAVDTQGLASYRDKTKFFSVHLFAMAGVTVDGSTFARHFASPPDIFEDPFTGSATGGMSAYIWHYGLIDTPTFIAEQGHWMNRPGQAYVEVVGPAEDIESVRVGGNAALIMTGELLV
ncbi:MAG: PhzF family phenazine biosynthesis protein [Rhodothermaceae bacterium]|nr:PhzF family phenazine biosynthesis protein [Rhodothermaceae bacterium]